MTATRYQWNAGGWIGAVTGATAWMLIGAGFLAANEQRDVAILLVVCFLLAHCCGLALWLNRERLDPLRGIVIQLILLSAITPVAWLGVLWGAPAELLKQMNWPTAVLPSILVCLVPPLFAAWFVWKYRQAQATQNTTTGAGTSN